MADPIYELQDQTITITRGQTKSETLSVYSDAASTTAVNITGATVVMTIRQSQDGPALIVLNNSSGITSIAGGASNNEYTYTIPDSATFGWNANTYFYDVVIQEVPNAGETWYHIRNSKFTVQSSPFASDNTKVRVDNYIAINDALIDSASNTELDGDKVDIDWNPTNYTPDSGISEADDADDLAAHLKGIDTALSTVLAGGLSSIVQDTTPQLGGQLDVNGNAIGDGTLELLTFTETGSAVNHVNVTNAATTNGPTVGAAGDDTNIDLNLAPKGTGQVLLGTAVGVGTSPGTMDTLNIDGDIILSHTATENDEHAFEIDCDAAGYGDVKALDIVYTTGAVAAGEQEGAILVNIDESAATGGDVFGFEVLTTTTGSATAYGMLHGPGVGPIIQQSGTFGNADNVDDNGTDQTTALSGGGAGNIAVFTNDNEYMIVGDAAQFTDIEFILGTGASGSGIGPTFEFSTGVGTWSTFSPTDGTNGMRNSGVIEWLLGDISGTWATGTGSEYLIRITRTRNTLGTTPVADLVQITNATEYSWDSSGDLTNRRVNVTQDIIMTEQADHSSTPGAGFGYLWVKSDAPSTLQFTDDTGADKDLTNFEAGADVTDATNVASAGAVMADGTGNDITGDLVFTEKADHSSTPGATKGYLWVKNTAPTTLIFTDDTGADTTLGSGGHDTLRVHGTAPTLGGTTVLTIDGSGTNANGYFLCCQAGHVISLAVHAETDVSGGTYDMHVEKSTDGGDTWNDLWGTAASGAVTLDSATNPEVNQATAAVGTYTVAAGDMLRVVAADNSSGTGAGTIHGQIRVVYE